MRGSSPSTIPTAGMPAAGVNEKPIIFFDIDNTLYSLKSGVAELMGERIHAYFVQLGNLGEEEARVLHVKYLTEYGLAIRGLSRHHDIDALDFNTKCDGSLPLEEVLHPSAALSQLFKDIDRSKARVWAFTNAYETHAARVLRILELEDEMEGIVYCDYAQPDFSCKPETVFYQDALKKANIKSPASCYFIDDNLGNVRAAKALGWGSCVYFREKTNVRGAGKSKAEEARTKEEEEIKGDETVEGVDWVISDLEELRRVWSELFVC